jgi:hypothetical protein
MRTLTLAAALAMVACLSTTAQPDETLTLACQGTATFGTEDVKPEPISMGIVVNFTAGTVQGFGGAMNVGVKITGMNEATVAFSGFIPFASHKLYIVGSIDRVTGDVSATSIGLNAETSQLVTSTSYALKCRPTQRMF